MAGARGSNREAEIKVWVPRSGDVAGVGNKAFFVDMSIRYKHSDLLGAGFTSPQLTGPGAHQNLPPFPKPATIGHDESVPNLVVLLDGTTVGARQGQNLAGLFKLTGVTNREDDEVELWDTWMIAAPAFGTGRTTLRVAVVDDLNHNGILDDAPDTVADSNSDGDHQHRRPPGTRAWPQACVKSASRSTPTTKHSTPQEYSEMGRHRKVTAHRHDIQGMKRVAKGVIGGLRPLSCRSLHR